MSAWNKTSFILIAGAVLAAMTFAMNPQPKSPHGPEAPETQTPARGGEISIPRDRDGHFRVTALVNGEPLTLLVDTGASHVVLRAADAERLGLRPSRQDFADRVETANGSVRVAPVELDSIEIGGLERQHVEAVIPDAPLSQSLLGMSFLNRVSQYRVERDHLILAE